MLSVFIDYDDRRPIRIAGCRGHYIPLDKEGHVDKAYLNRAGRVLAGAMESNLVEDTGKVVSMMPHILRRDHQWKPTRAEINKVIRAIWPETS